MFKASFSAALILLLAAGQAAAASCGKSAKGFDGFLSEIRAEAKAMGIARRGIAALDGVTYEQAARELGLREESARPAARLAQAKVRDWMKWLLALEGVSEREMDEAIADVQKLVGP